LEVSELSRTLIATKTRHSERIDEIEEELSRERREGSKLKQSLKEAEVENKRLTKQCASRVPVGSKDAAQIEVLSKRVNVLLKDRKERMSQMVKCTCGACEKPATGGGGRPSTAGDTRSPSPYISPNERTRRVEEPPSRSTSPWKDVRSRVFDPTVGGYNNKANVVSNTPSPGHGSRRGPTPDRRGPIGGGGVERTLTRREEVELKKQAENNRKPKSARTPPKPEVARRSVSSLNRGTVKKGLQVTRSKT